MTPPDYDDLCKREVIAIASLQTIASAHTVASSYKDAAKEAITAFENLRADRDEWRTQHENLLSVRQSDQDAIVALREQVAAKDKALLEWENTVQEDVYARALLKRAEKAEADNAALRKLLLRWLQIINRAKKDAATVAEWDKLRQESDAAMREGKG